MRLIGDGGYRELSPKRYELWQFVEMDGKRKQRTKRVRCGKRDVGDALRAFQSELSDQLPTSDGFAAYAASYMGWRLSNGVVSLSTYRNYMSMVAAFAPYMDCAVSDVTPVMVRDAMSALKSERGWSGTTCRTKYAMLHKVFAQAVKDGAARSNPLDAVDAPALDTQERVALSADQMDEVWANAEAMGLSSYTMAVFLALDCGLRIGECVWLLSADVGDSALTVSRSKTKAGLRTVPLTSRMAAKCEEWRAERDRRGIAAAETLLCRMDGLPMARSTLRNWYVSNHAALGAPAQFHDLRHSNLSKMARYMGVHDLQRWAGWGSIAMAARYVHDDYAQLEMAVQRLENVG